MPEIPLMLGSLGINNKVDPTDLQFDPKTGLVELAYAVNIDIERPFRIVSRRGYTKRISLANGAHSFFYAGGQFGVFASGSSLYIVTGDYSYTSVATITGGLKVWYCKAGDDIFYANGKENGVIKGSTRTRVDWKRETGYDSPPDYPTSSRAFSDFPIGTLLASVGSRIFCAVGDTVFYSEPWWYGYCDEEVNRFSLNGGITLLEAVTDGLYIVDSETAYWVKDIGDGRFDPVALPPGFGPAIPGTATRCDGKLVNDNYYGNGVIWVSSEQICWGGPGGFYMDLSSDRLRLPAASSGAGMMYDKKYVFVLNQ